MNMPTKICHCCGSVVPVSRGEAIEALVSEWRAWLRENGKILIPGDWIDEDLAAELVGTMKPGTLKNRRNEGKLPHYVHRGKKPLYQLHHFAGWIIDGCPDQ
ncbi:hypothetical protein HFP05_01260 [Rhodanobacter denitrificans]|nr:hypothetical protein [Rhodanobacter denitrificans]